MMAKVIVGSRGSRLATIQAESITARLKASYPGIEFSIRKIITTGDIDRRTGLDRIGTNVFVKELEEALLDGRINLAVHSLKDVPIEIFWGLGLVAVTEREDARDVLVARMGLKDLPPGARIGTGSLRRTVQLASVRPDIEICPMRGNLDTRLGKVLAGEVDGAIVAAAALLRLGLQDKVTEYLPLADFLPAAGQGTLGLEARSDDTETQDLLMSLNHLPTWQCIIAERSFLRELGGGCRAPIAVMGSISGARLRLDAMAASPAGKMVIRRSVEGEASSASALGTGLAREMLRMGASEFITEARRNETR